MAETDDDQSYPSTVWVEHVSWIERLPRWIAVLALGALLFGTWQLAHDFELVSQIILPSPLETIEDMIFVGWNILTGGYMAGALWITAQEILLGFVLAIVIGFVLGMSVGETVIGEKAVMPYLVVLNTMPKVAFGPLFVAWLGFGISSKVALAAFIAVFPIIIGTAAGIHAAEANSRMLFRSIGASRWQTLLQLKLPAGLPHFFAGLKNAAVFVVVGAVIGEFLGGGKGFGELVRSAASQLQTDRVFSLIIYLGLVGYVLFWFVQWLQRRVVFWHRETSESLDG